MEYYFTDAVLYRNEQEDITNGDNEADLELDDSSKKASGNLNSLVIELNDVNTKLEGYGYLMKIMLWSMSCLVLIIHLVVKMF